MDYIKDIVRPVVVPRFLFSDLPLENSAGKLHDLVSQRLNLDLALDLMATAKCPITEQLPLLWASQLKLKNGRP